MFGAQGEPMHNLRTAGQKSVFGTIDGSYDNSSVSYGGLGLGEFGFGYGIADGVTAPLKLVVPTKSRDLDEGDTVKERSFYLSPGIIADIAANVYATVGGYWGRRIASDRAYLNGGKPRLFGRQNRCRNLRWQYPPRLAEPATINETAITPYAPFSYAHTKVDAFSETNSSFPVSYWREQRPRDHLP